MRKIFFAILIGSFIYSFILATALADQTIAQFSGKLSSGKAITHHFLVDPCVQLTIRASPYYRIDGIKMTIIDPNGREIDYYAPSDYPGIKIHKGFTAKGFPFRFLTIDNPLPGKWSIELTSDQPMDKEYSIGITTKGSAYELEFSNIVEWVQPGEPVILEATINYNRKPVLKASVKADVQIWELTGVDESEILFFDDGTHGDRQKGDGVYTATVIPNQPGEISISLRATDGKNFERIGFSGLNVSRKGARIIKVVSDTGRDADRDGYYEALDVIVEVEVTDAKGAYSLSASLTDKEGYTVGIPKGLAPGTQVWDPSIFAEIPQQQGVHRVTLSFPAWQFRKSQSDGSYELHVQIEDDAVIGFPFGGIKETYHTRQYKWQDFASEN